MSGSFDYRDTIISEYANSPVITALIDAVNARLNPASKIDSFYDLVMNLDTAQGYGLDVWGRIVGVGRVVTVPDDEYFGFAGTGSQTFGGGPFYSGQPDTQNYALTDDAYRLLIYVKAFSNITGQAIPTINETLLKLFPGRGNAFVTNFGDMQAQLTFLFPLQGYERAILSQSGAFAGPTGVQMKAAEINTTATFGFAQAGATASGFGQGSFFGGSYAI